MILLINLTNGIQAIEDKSILAPHTFIRIQSTTIENKDYLKLFGDLDHNLLMNLALGERCVIYDYGANKPLTKVVRIGIPIIIWVLTKRWFGIELPQQYLTSGGNTRDITDNRYGEIYDFIFKYNKTKEKEKVRQKIDYYKRFLIGDNVNLHGFSSATSHDNDWNYYQDILKRSYVQTI